MSTSTTTDRRQVPDIPGSYYERLMEARDLAERQQWDEAAAIYQRVMERLVRLPERRRQPGSTLGDFLLAAASGLMRVEFARGDEGAGVQLNQQLQAWDPDHGDDWRRELHLLRIEGGKLEEGLQGLQELAEANPDNFRHWITLARACLLPGPEQESRLALAERALEEAQKQAAGPEEAEALTLVQMGYVELRRRQHRWHEAAAAWDQAVALSEAVEESREMVVRMFLQANLLDDAQRYISDESLGKPTADYYRAEIAYRRGDKVRARHLWRQVAETDAKQHPEALVARGLAHCWLEQPLEALSLLLREARMSREVGGQVAICLALAWAMQGDLAAARSDLALAQQGLTRPSGQPAPLQALNWFAFEELVADEAIKEQLRPYFDLEAADKG